MVYDYGVGDIDHHNIFKCHVVSIAWTVSEPCLHPNTVFCAVYRAVSDADPGHILLIFILAEAAHTKPFLHKLYGSFYESNLLVFCMYRLPYSMAWTASDVGNRDILATGSYGDTIITDSDCRRENTYVRGVTDMDAISVWAILRSNNFDIADLNVLASMQT